MVQDCKKLSENNLQQYLGKHLKRKKKLSCEMQNQVLDGLLAWHCVKDENILGVFIKEKITTKEECERNNAKLTNNAQDYIQGFDHCLSMSVGVPWLEYGPYAFAYGMDKISDDALFFSENPWKFSSDKLQKNLLVKKDFLVLQGELLSRNLYRLFKDVYVRLPFVLNYNKLLRHNVRRWEIKQTQNLRIEDSEEFIVYNQVHAFILIFNDVMFFWGLAFLVFVMVITGLVL